ncbi:LysE family translocator [Thermomonospora catenispora]|uniref:LysE family translocator n=1 Tax=Thermomonospora catenispora TaxID=2493090 RepID=UPI001121DE92|nr:LysE family translocator [Thermomonospora catenispora]TNY36966.1 LysE family translocator [Thermomonospora catenispora]
MTNPLVFLAAAVTLVAVPGPNHFYIIARSVGEGRRAGVVSALGVETGTLLHAVAAAAGLSALVAASATAFTALRYAGAAYLIFLAIRTFRDRSSLAERTPPPQPLPRVFLDGLLVSLFNPKVIVFFLAFLPQFVDPAAGSVPAQTVLLGLVVVLLGLLSDLVCALAGGALGGRLRTRSAFRRRQAYAACAVYLGLGLAALLGPAPRRAGA